MEEKVFKSFQKIINLHLTRNSTRNKSGGTDCSYLWELNYLGTVILIFSNSMPKVKKVMHYELFTYSVPYECIINLVSISSIVKHV